MKYVLLTEGDYSDYRVDGLLGVPDEMDVAEEFKKFAVTLTASDEEVDARLKEYADISRLWGRPYTASDARKGIIQEKRRAWHDHLAGLPGVVRLDFDEQRDGDYDY